jgi:very-short-patch-repair endonuclease
MSNFDGGGQSGTVADVPLPQRIQRWKDALLDLTFRNRLLNYRDTKGTIPLVCPDLGKLEDALFEKGSFSVLPRASGQGEKSQFLGKFNNQSVGIGSSDELQTTLKKKQLAANLPPGDLYKRLTEISRTWRTSVEETGANNLFLSLGFLHFYESESSDRLRMAPLILVPIEITRASVSSLFKVRQIDEETRVNTTLIEKLRSDFDIDLSELMDTPTDHAGADVQRILEIFAKQTAKLPRAEVRHYASISMLSFGKFLMWRELAMFHEELLKHPIINHLVHKPNESYAEGADLPSAENVDSTRKASELFCPLSADSSQLAAVMAAEAGSSFVLHGPPGTGKSQTITNLIAHCLAVGKSVLFVSEKRAALDVVYERLCRDVGIGEFCLELHSKKAEKAEVLMQLGQSLNAVAQHEPKGWAIEADRLTALRDDLNRYARELHEPRYHGVSYFAALSEVIGLKDVVPLIPIQIPPPQDLDHQRENLDLRCLAEYGRHAEEIGSVARHPWRHIEDVHWTPDWQEKARNVLETATRLLEKQLTCHNTIGEALALTDLDGDQASYMALVELADALRGVDQPLSALFQEGDWPESKRRLTELLNLGAELQETKEQLSTRYMPEIYSAEILQFKPKFDRWASAFFLFAFFALFAARRALRKIGVGGKLPKNNKLASDLVSADAYNKKAPVLAKGGSWAKGRLGDLWPETKEGRNGSGWDKPQEAIISVDRVEQALGRFAERLPDPAPTADIRRRLALLCQPGAELASAGSPLHQVLLRFVEGRGPLDVSLADAAELLGEISGATSEAESDGWLSAQLGRMKSMTAGLGQLREWCMYCESRDKVREQGLGAVVDAYEARELTAGQFEKAYKRRRYQMVVNRAGSESNVLRLFQGGEHSGKIDEFRKLDESVRKLSRDVIYARLSERVPSLNARGRTSELGLLQREIQKQRRHIAVRRLFKGIPTLLPRLKPCVLMSPLSVSQYLDISAEPAFDIVVFDEASQIPLHDAIGAIRRGKQLIVVGDPKQLPPTSFFARVSSEEEELEEGEVDEPDSVLDEVIAPLQSLHLNWHYRSRHESLIAFSNKKYYDDRLFTFPSAMDKHPHLGCERVDVPRGVYDRGASATNRGEAEALIDYLVGHLLDPARRDVSVGIVTFSVNQQRLIQNLLETKREEHPEIEDYFNADRKEYVFVKNLENVQGDERDVMLFSVGYGKDAQGKLLMNFGPLNKSGGERRLNVAITRARSKLIVFSSLRAADIDLSRTKAEGVKDLKAFLDYADRGPIALDAELSVDAAAGCESPFEEQVYAALTDAGYELETQVGCSGYRIDMAVKHPDRPGQFVLAVECDGRTYHSSASARDRDKLRQEVLENLGWRVHRIWSTDWWHDAAKQTATTVEAIKRAIAECEHDGTSLPVGPKAPGPEEQDKPTLKKSTLKHVAQKMAEATGGETKQYGVPYVVAFVDGPNLSPDNFYEDSGGQAIRDLAVAIVDVESPIHRQMLARRICQAFDMRKATSRVLARIGRVLGHTPVTSRPVLHGEFYWRPGHDPACYEGIRIPGAANGFAKRSIDEIAPEELANAAKAVLDDHGSMSKDDLVREVAAVFGIMRMGAKVKATVLAAIERAALAGHVQADGELLRLPGKVGRG